MPRRRDEDADSEADLHAEEDEYFEEEENERGASTKKRRRSAFIDDAAIEGDEVEENSPKRKQMKRPQNFFEIEAAVDSEEEEEVEDEGEEDFIERGTDILEEEDDRRVHRRPFVQEEEDVDLIARRIQERYAARSSHGDFDDFDEETTDVEQQALLPSVKDPKLWLVKCAIGHEREAALCLMHKYLDKGSKLQIRSAIALNHLKNYIYVEADKEAHVREACKGLRYIYSQKVILVPIKEMTEALSVKSKFVDLSKDAWVRMKIRTYKGDLAKVVDVDDVRQRIKVKLVPRLDLQSIVEKLDGKDVGKKTIRRPQRLFNSKEAKEMNIRVLCKRLDYENYEIVADMHFQDGFLVRTVSSKSVSTENVQPPFDELEKFQKPGDEREGGASGLKNLSTLFANRKKGHFMKGDAIIVVRGDLKNLKGWVEKVNEGNVHIRPKMRGLPETLTLNEKEICKYFKPGDHVKVVSGAQEGATGMVIMVEGHVLNILSDTTKEDIRVFAENVVESSEVTSGVTKMGDYELHDLVLLK